MKSAKQKERELIIKLSNEKKTCRDIASILGISKSKAAFWIGRFRMTGKLEDMPRSGRPTPLTKKELDMIRQRIKSKLEENSKRRKWTINKSISSFYSCHDKSFKVRKS